MRRCSEAIKSSALRYGTTRHMAPHHEQVRSDAKLGVPPLKWVYGDDLGNIHRLIDGNLNAHVRRDLDHHALQKALHKPAKPARPWPLSSTRILAPRALPISTMHSARSVADANDAAGVDSSKKSGATSPRGGVARPLSTRRLSPAWSKCNSIATRCRPCSLATSIAAAYSEAAMRSPSLRPARQSCSCCLRCSKLPPAKLVS